MWIIYWLFLSPSARLPALLALGGTVGSLPADAPTASADALPLTANQLICQHGGKYDWFKGGVTWMKCLNNQIITISRSFIELFVKNSVFVCSIWEVIWKLFFCCWVYRIWTQPARLYKWKNSHWCKVWEKKKKPFGVNIENVINDN